jgi:hypothetical protein
MAEGWSRAEEPKPEVPDGRPKVRGEGRCKAESAGPKAGVQARGADSDLKAQGRKSCLKGRRLGVQG